MSPSKQKEQAQLWRRLVVLALAAAALYAIIPQLGSFASSLTAIRHAQPAWLLGAVLVAPLTYVAAALVYMFLTPKPLRFWPTFLVQWASNFSNKLLPAGIGAIGVNYRYLRKMKHAPSTAAAVVATNNALGFVGNVLLLGLLIVTTSARINDVQWPHIPAVVYFIAAGALILLAIFWLIERSERLQSGVTELLADIGAYRQRPGRLAGALLLSVVLTASYAFALYACVQAVGLNISFTTTLIIMSIGVAGGTVIPTPGGLGGVEAGLVAGFVLYGTDSANALAVALLYRFVTYWLALLFGSVAFVYAGRKGYI